MSSLIDQATIQVRRDTASNWTSNDPVLNQGEWGLETDTLRYKIGDGSTVWASLAYADASEKITGSTDQIAKAWVNFNGTGTVAIRGSFNVSSISDLGTGIYQVNITNAMDDTNYIAVFSGGDSSTNQGRIMSTGATPTTSTYTVKTSDHAGNFEDWAYCNLVIYG